MTITAAKPKKVRARLTKVYTVKQVLHISPEMDDRLQGYVKAKGIKAPAVCIIALNEFLTSNNL